ncbi:MAG: DUF393 domain-containing protein [Gammaproteobacteria bacterium]|nr:DUF393 domain-containing protein [Gammaproteobacteria bacterium]
MPVPEVARPTILLIYDRECPACHAYCQVVRIRHTVGDLKIVNAREDTAVMDEITAAGLDIDQGMVLKVGDQLHYGAAAIHALALMSSRSGLFNRFNYWVFRSPAASAMLYPLLRSCRNLLLKLLGKSKINNLNIADNDKF